MKKRPNFRIIEGERPFDYEGFKRDFCNLDLKVDDLRKKYDLGLSKYNEYASKVKKESGFSRPQGRSIVITPTTYICKTKSDTDTYRIQKVLDGVKYHIGTFSDIESARKCRDYLIKHDWDWEAIKKVYEKHSNTKSKAPLRDEAMEKYDEFKDMYLHQHLYVSEIIRNLGINKYQYMCLVSRLKKEMPDAKKSKPKRDGTNYVYKNPMHHIVAKYNGKYCIQHKNKHYGTFDRLADAVSRRDELIRCGWND